MPCSDGGGWLYGPSEAELAKAREIARMEPMLCSACRTLERLGFDFDENPELSEWWDKHKAADRAREKEETRKRLELEQVQTIAKKPFNKLTDADKKLLKKHGYM